jgi:uncharacterized membrane protein YraQ (UPF0718 family)
MTDLIREITTWALAYLRHIIVMMYWVWIPGFLAAALVSVRYRPLLEQIVWQRRRGAVAVWAAVGWGMTSGAGRRTSLETAQRLWQEGLPDHVVLAYLAASQHLTLYGLVLFTVLIGLEFGLGLLLGGLAMIGLLRLSLFALPQAQPTHPAPAKTLVMAPETWKTLLSSGRGWGRMLRDIGGYLRNVGLSLVVGLFLGALILTIDMRGGWFFPGWMGDDTLGAALASAFLAPLLSVVLFLAPGGNLIVASSIWKTWTITYSGVISLVLMSLLNPLTIRALVHQFGRRQGCTLVLAMYFAAALSGLAVQGLLAVLGVSVTHVPWFRDLVDHIIMVLSFTMLGAPGGM